MTIGSWKFHLFHFFFMVESFITLAPLRIQGMSYRLIRYFCFDSLVVCIWALASPNKWYEYPPFLLQTSTFFICVNLFFVNLAGRQHLRRASVQK